MTTKTMTEPAAYRWARELDKQPKKRANSVKELAMIQIAYSMEAEWERDGSMIDPLIGRTPLLQIFMARCDKAGLTGMTKAFAVVMGRLLDRPALAVMYAAYVAYLADRDRVTEPGMKEYLKWFGITAFDEETLREAWNSQKLGNFDKGSDNMLDLQESYPATDSEDKNNK